MEIEAKVTKVEKQTQRIEPRGAAAYDKEFAHVSLEPVSGGYWEGSPAALFKLTIDHPSHLQDYAEGDPVTITIAKATG